MFLEKRTAYVVVKLQSEEVVQQFDSLQSITRLRFRRGVDGRSKQSRKPLQRVLIHWIDFGKVNDCEEEDRSAICNWSIKFSCLVDLNFSNLGLFLSHLDVFRSGRSIVKNVNEFVIFKNISNILILGQTNENVVLNLFKCFGCLRILLHNGFLLLLKFGHFLTNKLV